MDSHANGPTTTNGAGNSRRACDRCRNSKLRCERPPDSSQCHRCMKANVECITGAALRSGRPTQRQQAFAPQAPLDMNATNPGVAIDMPLLVPTLASYVGMENAWTDNLGQDSGVSKAFGPLIEPFQNGHSAANPQNDYLSRLGNLQLEVLSDLELVKHCKAADRCPELALPPELGYNPSFLVGRMLGHSKTLLEIMVLFGTSSPAPMLMPNGHGSDTLPTSTGSLRSDVPAMFSLFSCYVSLIRIYRTILSSIYDSMPILLSLQQPLPQLFPGMHLGGFTLETRLDLQVQFLIQVSEDMLSKLEAAFGIAEGTAEGATANKSNPEPSQARILSMMLEEEASEQPPLHEPRGHCASLKEILTSLKQLIRTESTKSQS